VDAGPDERNQSKHVAMNKIVQKSRDDSGLTNRKKTAPGVRPRTV